MKLNFMTIRKKQDQDIGTVRKDMAIIQVPMTSHQNAWTKRGTEYLAY